MWRKLLPAAAIVAFLVCPEVFSSPDDYDYPPSFDPKKPSAPTSPSRLPDRLPTLRPGTPAYEAKKAKSDEEIKVRMRQDAANKTGLWLPELLEFERTKAGSEERRQAALRLFDKTYKAGSWKDANFYASNLCMAYPDKPEYWVLRGKALYQMGKYAECLLACREAGKLHYETPELVDLQTNAFNHIIKTKD
jgi:hypothetical protein